MMCGPSSSKDCACEHKDPKARSSCYSDILYLRGCGPHEHLPARDTAVRATDNKISGHAGAATLQQR